MVHGYSVRYLNYLFLFLVLSVFVFLNGCSTIRKGDGPPPFYVDVSKIPDATPRVEPRAKYGNMPCYRVKGKSYRVLKSAKNFEEVGVASWYGMKFHSLRTSSGEPYNLLDMTAAHRTLPLPTYVQVTNLENGKKVIVKVNDRGPFASNRIIDLSYVAARKLGMMGRGTARVNIIALDPSQNINMQLLAHHQRKSHLYVKNTHPGNSLYLQVGAFKNRLYAEKLKSRLTAMVSSPIEIMHSRQASAALYRVQIGPIPDSSSATDIKKKLEAMGLKLHHVKV